jgi:c-di-GMP-binding flagellar brake protein YcgR
MRLFRSSPVIEGNKKGSKYERPKGILAVEKRKHPRYSVEFPLDYSLVDGKTTYNGGLTMDASEGGLLVYLPERIELGAILRIEIFYAKDLSLESIRATAKVVWSDLALKQSEGDQRYGLQFQSIDEADLTKLKTLLKEVAKAHA